MSIEEAKPLSLRKSRKGIKYKYTSRSTIQGRGRNKRTTTSEEGKAVQTSVWIGENTLDILKTYALQQQDSFSFVVRKALCQFIETELGIPSPLTRKEK